MPSSGQNISAQGSGHFEFVLKRARLQPRRKLLPLILGGAAVYRCDKWPDSSDGFSR